MCSYYKKLQGTNDILFPWKIIWFVKAPRRVSFFVWTATWGRILTHDNLIKRGFSLVGWCCMCRRSGETVDHLPLYCDVAYGMWCIVLVFLGFKGFYLSQYLIYCSGSGIGLGSTFQVVGILFHYVWCGLCRRNRIVSLSKIKRDQK